jgi:hypothetical protein
VRVGGLRLLAVVAVTAVGRSLADVANLLALFAATRLPEQGRADTVFLVVEGPGIRQILMQIASCRVNSASGGKQKLSSLIAPISHAYRTNVGPIDHHNVVVELRTPGPCGPGAVWR